MREASQPEHRRQNGGERRSIRQSDRIFFRRYRRNEMDRSAASIARRIRLAREGRSEALNELLDVHRNFLRLLATTSLEPALAGKVDASDVVQETLLRAYEAF